MHSGVMEVLQEISTIRGFPPHDGVLLDPDLRSTFRFKEGVGFPNRVVGWMKLICSCKLSGTEYVPCKSSVKEAVCRTDVGLEKNVMPVILSNGDVVILEPCGSESARFLCRLKHTSKFTALIVLPISRLRDWRDIPARKRREVCEGCGRSCDHLLQGSDGSDWPNSNAAHIYA